MNYILQKDLPGTKAGMLFTKKEDTAVYVAKDQSCGYKSSLVENNTEFFLPEVVEEKIYIWVLPSGKIEVNKGQMSYTTTLERLLELLKHDDGTGWNDKDWTLLKMKDLTSEYQKMLDHIRKKQYTEEDMRTCFTIGSQHEYKLLHLSHSFEFYFKSCLEEIKKRNKNADTGKGG